jgi:phage-related tail fiber protein
MAQADQSVQNATFPTVRADINNNLAALFSDSSGTGAPTVTVAFQDWIDTSGSDAVWKKRNAANNAWLTIGTFAGAGLSLGGAVPAGSIQFFAGSSAPTGYLKANGALISRTTYADLFTAIGTTFGVGDGSTTFALPDLRGEFARGWDDGREVDSGRAFGSAQADAFQGHKHQMDRLVPLRLGFDGGIDFSSAASNPNDCTLYDFASEMQAAPVTDGTNGTPRTGTETRPRNIALLACIKY